MNTTQFPLKKTEIQLIFIFTFLPAIVFGFICFLSLNFLSLGNISQSLFFAVILAIVLCGLTLGAIWLKKTSRPTKAKIIWEGVLLILFVVLAFVAIFPFSHYFVVSEKKLKIKQDFSQNVAEALSMFEEYHTYASNRETDYKDELGKAILKIGTSYIYLQKHEDMGFSNNGIDTTQMQDKIKDLHKGLFVVPDDFYKGKTKDSIYLSECNNSIDSWKPITIPGIVKEMENNIPDMYNKLVARSKAHGRGEQYKMFDKAPKILNVTNQFKKEFKDLLFTTTPFACAFAIFLFVIMWIPWMPWIGINRHSKYPGLDVLFNCRTR